MRRLTLALLSCGALLSHGVCYGETTGEPGFSFDCDNTPSNPCRTLSANHDGRNVTIEPSSVAWSERFRKAIVVNDNYNHLLEDDAAHFVVVYFDLDSDAPTISVKPLLTPDRAKASRPFDLESVALAGEQLYAIGSLALHGKNPERDRWERHQFVRMDLEPSNGGLKATNLSHLTERWPNFRDWVVSKSGHPWSGEEIRSRAEGEGLNVEALATTSAGTLLIGFRGPLAAEGGSLLLEIEPPVAGDQEPRLVKTHVVPSVDVPHIAPGAPKTLRGIVEVPGHPGEYYVLLGPKGYEKESIVLARWSMKTNSLTKATELPSGLVPEGVAPIGENRLLIVDDLKEAILIATEH